MNLGCNSVTSLVSFHWCGLSGRVISLSWHPSGSLIAAGMMDMIRVFDAETGEEKRPVPDVTSLQFTVSPNIQTDRKFYFRDPDCSHF